MGLATTNNVITITQYKYLFLIVIMVKMFRLKKLRGYLPPSINSTAFCA
jgi:hypothetical protein